MFHFKVRMSSFTWIWIFSYLIITNSDQENFNGKGGSKTVQNQILFICTQKLSDKISFPNWPWTCMADIIGFFDNEMCLVSN